MENTNEINQVKTQQIMIIKDNTYFTEGGIKINLKITHRYLNIKLITYFITNYIINIQHSIKM